ncbi:hypothetical protein BKA61DRAFT_722771 [Leptodontidium sp. MPI-SDFR-AT-0119]|nr:hypothetical protein BKA61DRAFT_722771 [Leptodontidium sp. MPI-SDFR-AT-0119]
MRSKPATFWGWKVGFPGTTGTCPQVNLDPQNCCDSDDPATCLDNWKHDGSGSTPNPCYSVVSLVQVCSASDPGLFPSSSIYTSGPQGTSLAGCLCYQSSTYHPELLGGFASGCVASGSAAHPTYFPYASHLSGFCENIAGPATAAASTTNVSPDASTTSNTNTQTTDSSPATTTSGQQTTNAAASSSSQATVTSAAALGTTSATSNQVAASTSTSGATSKVVNGHLSTRMILLLGISIVFCLQ